MKKTLKFIAILLLTAFPAVVFSQTVVVEFMKVSQENENLYLQVEQQWEKVHKARIDAGLINGWSLYRNVAAGFKDPYQYITITWYDNMEKAAAASLEGLDESIMSQLDAELLNQTAESRVLAHRDFSHSMAQATNNHGSKFLVINRMRPTPGNWDAYVKSENEVFKPIFEESIKEGTRSSWGLWQTWPYQEGQIRLITVDGFNSLEQQNAENIQELFTKVFPDKDINKVAAEVLPLRDQAQVEVWQLVDSVWPEQD
jgi:hypothetical protein